MKTFSPAALDALRLGSAIVSASVEFYGTPAIFLFGGHGELVLPADGGTATFKGLGAKALVRVSGGSVGGTADSITLVLSGIDPAAIDVLDASEISGAPAVIRRLIFDSTGKSLLDSHVFTRGRVDTVSTRESIGQSAAIEVAIESAARGLGRRGARMRSDADQRLINSTDGFFKSVSIAGQKTLYWGGKRPSTPWSSMTPINSGSSWSEVVKIIQ